jgi:hypothetical protein
VLEIEFENKSFEPYNFFNRSNAMRTAVNYNDVSQIRKVGIKALTTALGASGMAKFIQLYSNGYGDYTKEKYQYPDWSADEIENSFEFNQ